MHALSGGSAAASNRAVEAHGIQVLGHLDCSPPVERNLPQLVGFRNLLLLVNQFEGFAGPAALRVGQRLDERHRIISSVFVIVGAGGHEPGRQYRTDNWA